MTKKSISVAMNQNKYPAGVFIMSFLQLLSMVGFSLILSLLVLYCTRQLGMSDDKAYALSAAYNALVFATSVFGGYLGEKYLGYRHAVILSIVLAGLGLFIMGIPSVMALYWGLAFFTIATGIMVPCMFVLLGRIFGSNDPRRDSGFTLAYIGMNVGSFFAAALSGYLANDLGYGATFIIGGIFTFLTLIVFLIYQDRFSRKYDVKATPGKIIRSHSSKITGVFLILVSIPLTAALLNFANLSNILMLVLGLFSVALVIYIARQESTHSRKKLMAFLILTIISVAFWSLYSIAPSALTIFIADNVNRQFFSYVIPAASYSALNPLFIITLGPLLTLFWMSMNQRGKNFSTPGKFALGVTFMGLGYLVLILAISTHNQAGYISSWWIVLSYFLQTFGELFVGPIGYAMVGELVPPKFEGLMMGIWQLATGVAGALSQYMADMTSSPQSNLPIVTDQLYSHAFALFGGITVVVGCIAALLVPYLKRIITESDA
ncbi:MAG: hypothetical protein A3E87_03530 [Gammaproteobacteria bacterium RIFCSPHIGHO2_12_FULL_35_23]|nr:MAG: hypothetical protein A3E87_03530 [Gammaproteobacteria bacterium RIFCSPHIGHO2_12_FULL_35_23]